MHIQVFFPGAKRIGEGMYIHIFPDGFLLKSVVFELIAKE
jgi:hypothetical protein